MAPFRARFECGLVSGDAKKLPVTFERLPPVAADFCAEDLRANIRDSRWNGQQFRDFTRRAMAAGVQGYYAFLRGPVSPTSAATASSTRNGSPARSR